MYQNTNWLDRVVDADSGEVIQEGTDQSAANFNNMEEGISDAYLAIALMQGAMDYNRRIAVLEVTITADQTGPSVPAPFGFTDENTIIITALYTKHETGKLLKQIVPPDMGNRAQVNLFTATNPPHIKVSTAYKGTEELLLRILLFKYK